MLVAEFHGMVSSMRMMAFLLLIHRSGLAVVEIMEEGTVAGGLS